MKKEKTRDEFDIQGSSILSDEIMEKIAEILDEELTADLERYAKMDVEIPPEHDRKMLEMARRCDRERVRAKRRTACRKAVRVAAVFLVVMLALGGIGMSSSEAFRMRVFNLFENKEDDAVVLRNGSEMEILKGWSNYWYPEYLPEAYYLFAADVSEFGKVMCFNTASGDEVRIYERTHNRQISVDVDTNKYKQLYTKEYEIYVFCDSENDTTDIIWMPDDATTLQILISGIQDDETVSSIIQNMRYIQ